MHLSNLRSPSLAGAQPGQNLLRQQLHQELGRRLVGPQGRAEHMRRLMIEAQVLAAGRIRAQRRGQGLAHYVTTPVPLAGPGQLNARRLAHHMNHVQWTGGLGAGSLYRGVISSAAYRI